MVISVIRRIKIVENKVNLQKQRCTFTVFSSFALGVKCCFNIHLFEDNGKSKTNIHTHTRWL
jgi:hypothetical protein